jgi:hypothetical protein
VNLELHKELYFFEWTRKEQLASAVNLPQTLLTVIAGGMFYLLQSFPYTLNYASAAFVLLGGLSLFSQLAALTFLFRSVLGYWYEQLPASDKLQEFFEELKQWHTAQGHTLEGCQQDFNEYLQGKLAEATAANLAVNTKVAAYLDKATRSLLFAFIFAGLSLIPYLPEFMAEEPKAASVAIEGPV